MRRAPNLPESLILLAILVAFGFAAAFASLAVQRVESGKRERMMASQLTGGGDAKLGPPAMMRYGCGACHEIPGVPRAAGTAAPNLKGVGARAFIAGNLANDPPQMVAFLRHPQAVSGARGMPEMGVTDKDARDMAAYLYTLK